MSLQYIIDGYNIINHPLYNNHHKKNIEPQRELLEFIRHNRLCGSPKNTITVVFDGYSNSSQLRQNQTGINIIFSQGDSADEMIKKIVQESAHPKNIAVVSDDKAIKFFIKSAGSHSMGVEEFLGPALRLKKRTAKDRREERVLKPELNTSEISKINQELKKIWLR